MKSLVINVNVIQQYKEGKSQNSGWINFFDVIFEKDIDYINIDYLWKEDDKEFNDIQFEKLVKKLSEIYHYYDKNNNDYEKMALNGYNKVNIITKEFINESIYELFYQYNKKCNTN